LQDYIHNFVKIMYNDNGQKILRIPEGVS